MGSVFHMDSKVQQVVDRIIDLVKLNILWILCSLPIVTIGASTSALLYVTRKLAAGKDGYVARTFLMEVRKQFLSSLRYWLPTMLAAFILWLDYWFFRGLVEEGHSWALFMVTFTVVGGCVLGMVLLYLFTLTTVTEYKGKTLWKNAIAMTFKYLPKSFMMFLWVILAIIAAKIWAIAALVIILLGGATVALFQGYVMNGILNSK